MTRRQFLAVGVGVLVAPRIVKAQQAGKIYRIGLLRLGVTPLSESFWAAMRDLGWIEGRNVKVEARYAESDDQLPALAAELAQSKVDLIMTIGTAATRAAKGGDQVRSDCVYPGPRSSRKRARRQFGSAR
jgi:hypothetical protein